MTLKRIAIEEPPSVEWGKLGLVVIAWGFVSLFVAMYYSISQSSDRYNIELLGQKSPKITESKPGEQPVNQIGPIVVDRPGETFEVTVRTAIPQNRWAFVEVEVLDQFEEYLYSFGQELWHETGRDSDGPWREQRNNFETKITFPEPGYYYLNFWTQANYDKTYDSLKVRVYKRNGSSVLHSWFGIILLVIGLILVEIQWGIFQKAYEVMNDSD